MAYSHLTSPGAEDSQYLASSQVPGRSAVGETYEAAGVIPKGGQKVCVHFNRPKGCLRGDLCPDRHVEVDLCDVPYGKVPVKIFDEDESNLLPQPGSSVTVIVSAVFTPSLFYVTLPSGDLTLQQLHDPLVRSQHCQKETLESMMASMQEFYGTYPGYDGDLTLLAPGEAMAAKVQGKWVRAKVIFTDVEHGLVQVVLVDYGCVDWVSERDLRELGLQFLHLTPQAIECCLVDLEPPNETGRWSEETCKHFSEMVKGKTLLAWVKHRYPSGKIGIVLFDTSEKTNTSVNQQLEDSGLAHHPAALGTVETCDKSLGIDDGRTHCFMPA